MMLRLVLETAPHPQARAEFRLAEGQVVIGRGDDCDWKIDDPQMFVSRRHCVVTGRGGQFQVTDESRGGLFLDDGPAPLGQGVSAPLRPGMRFRLGDFVIRVEAEAGAAAAPSPPPPQAGNSLFGDDFFTPRPEPAPPPRPASLPDPFDAPRQSPAATPAAAAAPRQQPGHFFDDPFSMDPAPAVSNPQPMPVSVRKPASGFDFGDFGLPADLPPPKPAASAAAQPAAPDPVPDTPVAFDDVFPAVSSSPPPPRAVPAVEPPAQAAPPAGPSDAQALEALFRGMGIAPPAGFRGTPEDVEALGRRFRLMAEGVVALLRMRAQEKGAARVAQTVIGAANVNPLKFTVAAEDAVAALVAAKGPGYLEPDAAIAAALGDLMDHHKRSWTGLQAALRRMIDRFDPALFEAEVEDVGMLKALVAGSRSARLWQLYADRYRDIAKSAEDRFLGDVGADFRDAYEGETGRKKDGTA